MTQNSSTSSDSGNPNRAGEAAAATSDLAQVEANLAVARQRLALMLDAAGATCGWDWDIVGNYLTADARFAAITGQDPVALAEGVPTGRFFAGIHPDDVKRIRLAVAGMMAGAEVFSKEYRLLKEDGGFRWVHATGRAVFDESDRPIRFIGMLVDITEQKRIQEQLRIAQVAGGIGTFEHVAGYGTIMVSEHFCHLFGLHPTKVLPARTVNLLIHPDDQPIIDPDAPAGHPSDANSEFRIRRADNGAERWIAKRGEYVQDADAPGQRYIGVIYDITDAKHTEERLREANEALAERVRERTRERNRMWQNSRDVLVVLNSEGMFIDVNPAWPEVLGHEPGEVIGRHFLDFAWPEDYSLAADGLFLAKTEDLTNFEIRLVHKDGTMRWLSWMTSHENDIVYAYGRHVTVEKEQAKVLRETEAQLRQSQKMEAVGQLTGGIAHDFNNMLTGVIAALDILRRRIAAGRVAELDKFIDAATASAQRAASLTHRLLAFSRRQSLDRQPIDVGQLIFSLEELLHRTLGEQIALSIEIDPATWRAVTDANQLESALLNLVINARDAMPQGGRLTIETANIVFTEADLLPYDELRPGHYVVIAVSDIGMGMPPDVIEKAFDPFFTTKPIGQGTGLGLSMIYGFAQQSGGHVRIQSVVGEGTTIKLYLPRSHDELSPLASSAQAGRVAPLGSGETILVIEDDDAVRFLVLDVLRDLGYAAIEAVADKTALPIIESSQRIDLLISDVGLPGLNGRQLAEIALKARPDLKVLFITGYAATAASRAEFLAPGMEMITKPFTVEDLAWKVREMLTSGRARDQGGVSRDTDDTDPL